jgi:purine-binding chemotaxis protein CheW
MTRLQRRAAPWGMSQAGLRGSRQLLVFHLGSQAYALSLGDVQEVLPLPLLAQPPLMPALLAGFLNLGGSAVPVIRLDHLFERGQRVVAGRYTPLVLLRPHAGGIALLVERVSEIIRVGAAEVLPLPDNQAFNDCVSGIISRDERLILVVDSERLLLEKEEQYLAEWQDREQARLRGLEDGGA